MNDFDSLRSIEFSSTLVSSSFGSSTEPFELRNLPALERLTISSRNFYITSTVRLINLPKLASMDFGDQVFFGSDNSTLVMNNIGTEAVNPTQMTVRNGAFGGVITAYLRGLL